MGSKYNIIINKYNIISTFCLCFVKYSYTEYNIPNILICSFILSCLLCQKSLHGMYERKIQKYFWHCS